MFIFFLDFFTRRLSFQISHLLFQTCNRDEPMAANSCRSPAEWTKIARSLFCNIVMQMVEVLNRTKRKPKLTWCHGGRRAALPVQMRKLFNWLLHVHILLHCHGAVVKTREHWVQRSSKHVARAADCAASHRKCWCLWVAHTIVTLELVRIQHDCWPV